MSIFEDYIPPGLEDALTGMEKQFVMMRSSGSSVRDIAKTLKKSTRTICDWNKKFAKEIIGIRNSEFSDLQKKVIESKSQRLNLLKSEFDRVSGAIKKQKMDVDEPRSKYNNFLELYIKLSDLMSACESDMLSVGVKFKDNIEPEINLSELDKEKSNGVAENVSIDENNVSKTQKEEVTENKEVKEDGKQSKTKCNTKTPKKYEAYNKHRFS